MTKKRPKILLTNDDGIFAPGIFALWQALDAANFADLSLVAPAHEKSGAGSSVTWDRSLLIQEVDWEKGTKAWSVDGTPADCVKMALTVILPFKPDLIVSGINAGSNAGRNVLHSGTVGAVVEGILRDIPGVALSCENGSHPNFHVAQKYVEKIVKYILDKPFETGTLLNVNFPHAAKEEVKGFRMTRQGMGRWIENPVLHLDTNRGPTYFLGGKPEELDERQDSDISLLLDGYMTAVPIHVHELTNRAEVDARRDNFESFFLANDESDE
jgi:5'-nucleotidase